MTSYEIGFRLIFCQLTNQFIDAALNDMVSNLVKQWWDFASEETFSSI